MTRDPAVFCFDLDDTLVSECDFVETGLRSAGALVDAAYPAAEPAGVWLVELWRRERPRDGFQRLLRARGLSLDVWLPRLRAAYRSHEPSLQPREGVRELLTGLLARGARLALVSDGHLDVQRRKWASLRLPFDFYPTVFTDERGREFWKPHRWAFDRVMEVHADAGRFVYVADNPVKDFIAPNLLGWTTVMVRDARNLRPPATVTREARPSWTIDRLPSLIELFWGGATRSSGRGLRAIEIEGDRT